MLLSKVLSPSPAAIETHLSFVGAAVSGDRAFWTGHLLTLTALHGEEGPVRISLLIPGPLVPSPHPLSSLTSLNLRLEISS